MINIKNIKNIIIIFLNIIITYHILTNSTEVLESVKYAFDIWKNSIFPSIFPFFIISSILISYGLVEILGELFKPLMNVFGIDSKVSFVFIMSMLSGFPSSSKYIKELYDKNIIDDNISTKALMFTHFSNPLFIIGTISPLLNKKIVLLILIVHYLTNILIGILFRNYKRTDTKTKIDLSNIKFNKVNLGYILAEAIYNSIKTLLLILGTISCFNVLICIIDSFNLSPTLSSLISGVLEITTGINKVSLLNISTKLKATLITMFLSFGGLSIHMQVYSIISETKIKYKPYLIARIIHSIISGAIIYLIV